MSEPSTVTQDPKPNYVIIIIGIFILLISAAGFILYKSIFNDANGFVFVRIFLALGSALVTSQLAGIFGIHVGTWLNGGGALGVFAFIVLITKDASPIAPGKLTEFPNLSGRWIRETDVDGKLEVYTFIPSDSPGQYRLTIDYEGRNLPDPPLHYTGSGGFLKDSTTYAEFDVFLFNPSTKCTVHAKYLWKFKDENHAEEGSRPIPETDLCGYTPQQFTSPISRRIRREGTTD